jgi:hypothetical protein
MKLGLPVALTTVALPALAIDIVGCVVNLHAVVTNTTLHRAPLLGISLGLALCVVTFLAMMALIAARPRPGPARAILSVGGLLIAYGPVAVMFYTLEPS